MNQRGFKKMLCISGRKQFVKISTIILFLLYAAIAIAESGNVNAYKGNFSGEWSGEVSGVPVNGIFSVSILDEGKVAGSFSGFEVGAISGTVSADGLINAKGSAGLSEWTGKVSVAEEKLSGSGSWIGYGGGGTWSSK